MYSTLCVYYCMYLSILTITYSVNMRSHVQYTMCILLYVSLNTDHYIQCQYEVSCTVHCVYYCMYLSILTITYSVNMRSHVQYTMCILLYVSLNTDHYIQSQYEVSCTVHCVYYCMYLSILTITCSLNMRSQYAVCIHCMGSLNHMMPRTAYIVFHMPQNDSCTPHEILCTHARAHTYTHARTHTHTHTHTHSHTHTHTHTRTHTHTHTHAHTPTRTRTHARTHAHTHTHTHTHTLTHSLTHSHTHTHTHTHTPSP